MIREARPNGNIIAIGKKDPLHIDMFYYITSRNVLQGNNKIPYSNG